MSSNSLLLALDETSNEIRLADFAEPRLNRYCFLTIDALPNFEELMATVLGRVVNAQGLDVRMLVVWKAPGQDVSRIRSMALERTLRKQGWNIACDDSTCFATSTSSIHALISSRPTEASGSELGWAILLGPWPPVAMLQSPPFSATLALLAKTRLLYPSRDFLEGLIPDGLGIAYPAKDSLGRQGMVVVTSTSFSTLLERLLKDGVLVEVRRGDTAPSIWQQSGHV